MTARFGPRFVRSAPCTTKPISLLKPVVRRALQLFGANLAAQSANQVVTSPAR